MAAIDTEKVKQRLDAYIEDHFAVGNKRNADIEEFELREEVLHFKLRVQSKEVKRTPFGRVTVYSLTYHVEGDVNLISPDPDDVKICVDAPWPVNSICVTAREIAEYLMA
ncbi:hypothetical protein [Paenibacillus amylolyticus]|uniref:hypothetical protein n=1 Tax=Paenibacillus amylolyticus TaxID=1451 RepID=UPI000FD90901|nr:hypothetical protein [Paenibacillus amylolyticus]